MGGKGDVFGVGVVELLALMFFGLIMGRDQCIFMPLLLLISEIGASRLSLGRTDGRTDVFWFSWDYGFSRSVFQGVRA